MNTARAIATERNLIVPTTQFGLSSREIELIRSNNRALDGFVAVATDAYYEHLRDHGYDKLLPPNGLGTLKAARIQHWRMLLECDFFAVQNDYHRGLGPRLIDFGIPQSVYVIASSYFSVEFARFIEKSRDIPRALKHELRIALIKLAFYDLAVAQVARDISYVD